MSESTIDRARQAAERIASRVLTSARRRLDELAGETPAPSPVVSGRVQRQGRLEDYRERVDDSRLYRDPSRRSPEEQAVERLLVRTSGESVQLRGRGQGSIPDRYLSIVAEVPDLPQKQGLSGTPTAGGLPQVENKQQLKPLVARGLTYDQGEFERMSRSNPVVRNAVRSTVERIAQGSEFYATPDVDFEALVDSSVDPVLRSRIARQMREATDRAAEVLNLEWYHNPAVDAQQVIREQSYAMVPGFALHEFGLDPRLQGRRRTTFVESRAASSVLRWLWDETERWRGVVQNASGSPGLLADIPVSGITVQGMPVIDSRKLCLVSNQRIGLNLEGVSDLRAAWYASQGKTEWFVSALMHRRKWGNGFPLFRMDPEAARSKAVSDSIKKAAEDFFYSGQAFVSLPAGVTMEMMEFDSDTGFIAAMEYFDKELLRSLGALVTEIGQNGGSYNLADVQQQERLRQMQGYTSQIKASRRSWIEAACATLVGDLGVLPELRIDGVMTRSDSEVIAVWTAFGQIQSLVRVDGSPVYSDDDLRSLASTIGVDYTSSSEARDDRAIDRAVEATDSAPVSEALVEATTETVDPLSDLELPDASTLTEQDDLVSAFARGSRLAARTLDDVDTTPTRDMARAAQRALEWRREHGRGGTEVGVARARDLANRRRLSEQTVRRMKAYFDRHEVDSKADGWNAGERGFPSAGRIAWDLWGGNAGRGWSARKVAEFDRIRQASRSQRRAQKSEKARLSARRADVIVRGRDARAFSTHRQLVGIEQFVSWASLYSAIDREAQSLALVSARVAEAIRTDYVKRVKDSVIAGDVEAVARTPIGGYEQLREAVGAFLTGWSAASRREMLGEIKAQVGSSWQTSLDEETFPAELEQIVSAQAEVLAQQLEADWAKRLRESAMQQATGLRSVDAIRAVEPPLQTWTKASTNTTTGVSNLVREETARVEGPAIKSAQYSAIMDRLTCDNCRALDGQTFAFGSAQYIRNRPPLYNCKSTLGPYGNVCRCIYVYEFESSREGFSGPSIVAG